MRSILGAYLNRPFWFFLLISIVFFLLRFPSFFEPFWYGDEGIYYVIGKALQEGQFLYSDIWDNKPPLLYIIYALFSPNSIAIKFVSALFSLSAIFIFFSFSLKLFPKKFSISAASILSTILFALLLATPFIEGNIANAENFLMPFTLFAGMYIYKNYSQQDFSPSKKTSFIAGIFLGIAILFKTVAIFDCIAFSFFILLSQKKIPEQTLKEMLRSFFSQTRIILLGISIPLLITFIYFLVYGNGFVFLDSVLFHNVDYVAYNNSVFLYQGLLLIKIILLFFAISVLYLKRHLLSTQELFIYIWLFLSLFSTFFSQRSYTHYALLTLPALCFVFGLIINKKKKGKILPSLFFIVTTILLLSFISFYGLPKTFLYYGNFFSYLTHKKNNDDYMAFFDKRTPRDYDIAYFIRNNITESDTVFVWGNSPQIYLLSNTLPINRYTVAYHINENAERIKETQYALEQKKPKFIVIFTSLDKFPFSLHNYVYRFTYKDIELYERIN